MSAFWEDEERLAILKECLSAIISETNAISMGRGKDVGSIIVFIAMIQRNKSVCMQVYDAKTLVSKMRFSGIPQRTDAETWASKHHDLSLSYILSPIKKGVADLVDMLLRNHVNFRRMTIRLRRQKRHLLNKLLRKSGHSHAVQDEKGRIWGHSLQLDSGSRNEAFEEYVDWVESGTEGDEPKGEWNGQFTFGGTSRIR